jgi:hypothetical protein
VSKDDNHPAAIAAAGPSPIPQTDQAVLLAAGRFAKWLREQLGDDLTGKQMKAAVHAAAQAFVPVVRGAAVADLADALAASPKIMDELGEAIRGAATAALARDWGVPDDGS